ncbi:MAG: HPF/RaiA family ribosome-associated protein [Gammaproteobacteria bacterium]
MQININTDKTIERSQGLDEHVETTALSAIGRFRDQITRVDVHLSDDLSQKSVDGANRCMMEARVTGYQSIAVTAHGASLHQAIGAAAEKLKRAIDSALGRLHDKKLHAKPELVDEIDSEVGNEISK